MPLNLMTITAENVSGLVVGEGCFYCESSADLKYKLGWRIRPAFCVEMRVDDREVLEAVQYHLGCGRIYDLDFGRYKSYENRNWMPHAKFHVTALPELRSNVVPFFERHPLFGRKADAFRLFSSLVSHLSSGHHRTEEGLEIAKRLASQLSQHNSRGKGN